MAEIVQHVLAELSSYLNGRLSRADRQRVEAHLEGCGSCRSHADALESLRGRTTDGLTRYQGSGGKGWVRLGLGLIGGCLLIIVGRFIIAHRTVTPPKAMEIETPKAEPVKKEEPTPPPPAPVEAAAPAATPAPEAPSSPSPAAAPASTLPADAASTVAPSAPAQTQWRGVFSAISEFRPVIIQTPEAWKALWQEHNRNQSPIPPVPTVDFAQSMVVGIYSGNKPSGGYSVEIVRLNNLPDQLLVEYKETAPTTVANIAAITSPFHLKVIPKTDLPIRFQKL